MQDAFDLIEPMNKGRKGAARRTALSTEPRYAADYYRGWEEGFRETMTHLSRSFDQKAAGIKIWQRLDLEQFLWQEKAGLNGATGGSTAYRRGQERGRDAAWWCCATLFGVNLFAPKSNDALTSTKDLARSFSSDWLVATDVVNMLAALHTTAAELSARARDYPTVANFYRGFEAGIRQIEACFNIRPVWSRQQPAVKVSTIPLWLRRDLNAKLQALYARQKSGEPHPDSPAFQAGYQTALQTIAGLLGLNRLR